MNNIKTMVILTIIAALMFVPHAVAVVEVGFGTPYVSAGSSIIGPGIYFDQENMIIGGNELSLESIGGSSSTGSGSGQLAQYWQAQSPNGKYIAASYAYLGDSGAYSYKFVPSSTTSSASVKGHVAAIDADDILFGGFAYNGISFAAVDLVGDYADFITYDNALSASKSKVSAEQTFTAEGAENFKIGAYAAKGTFDPPVPEADLPEVLSLTDNPDLAAGQFATITGGDIKSYKSSASVSSTTASASQKAAITEVTPGEDNSGNPIPAEAQFWGFSWQSNPETGVAVGAQSHTYLGESYIDEDDAEALGNVGYNAVATSTSKGTASASQDGIKAQGAEYFNAGAWSARGEGLYVLAFAAPYIDWLPPVAAESTNTPVWSLYAGQNAWLNNEDEIEITSYKSSASADAKTATASQSLKTKGTVDSAGFYGNAGRIGNDASTSAETGINPYGGKDITYNAKSTGTAKGSASSSQDFKAVDVTYFYAWGNANDYNNNKNLGSSLSANLGSLSGVDITSYKSSASADARTATSSQSLRTKGNADGAEFYGNTMQNGINEYTTAGTEVYFDGGKDITYNAKSTGTASGSASASQDLKAGNILFFSSGTGALYYDDGAKFGSSQSSGLGSSLGVDITSYKGSASVDAKTATSSHSLSTKGTVYDAEFLGSSGMDEMLIQANGANYPAVEPYARAENYLYIVDAKNLNYLATSSASSNGAASVSQEVTSETASYLDANAIADSNNLQARQSAEVSVDDDDEVGLFQVKSYKSAASVNAKTASASQSANLPSIEDAEYEAKFCGSSGQVDDGENFVYAQAATDADDAQDVVYSAKSASAQTVTASATQTFSASEFDSILADALTTKGGIEFTGYGNMVDYLMNSDNLLETIFAYGPDLAAAQVACLEGDGVKVKSYTSSASVSAKAASASQNARTVGTLERALFVGGSLQESEPLVFAAAVAGGYVDTGKDVSYDGKVTSAGSAQATGSQTLAAKSADAVVQAALAANQNEEYLQYAGSIDLAGDVYGQQILRDDEGHPIYVDSGNKVTSYSGSDSVSTTTDKNGKVTTTETNALNARGGFLGRAIAAGKGDAITYDEDVLGLLPLTLNPEIDGDDLQTATKNIIPVANPQANAVGVVGETLVFAPILSNDGEGRIIADRESNLINKNSLSGKSTATVITDNLGKTTSTLSGSWKATAQKDTTDPFEYAPHDINSIQRFAYASNDGIEIFAGVPTNTMIGAASISYKEKAKETDGADPTASV